MGDCHAASLHHKLSCGASLCRVLSSGVTWKRIVTCNVSKMVRIIVSPWEVLSGQCGIDHHHYPASLCGRLSHVTSLRSELSCGVTLCDNVRSVRHKSSSSVTWQKIVTCNVTSSQRIIVTFRGIVRWHHELRCGDTLFSPDVLLAERCATEKNCF